MLDFQETKVVLGQGAPIVTTRFVDPSDLNNSWWMPSSVTGVQAQPWDMNYRDGMCVYMCVIILCSYGNDVNVYIYKY